MNSSRTNEDSQKPISDHLPKVDPAAQDARLKYWEDVLTKTRCDPARELSPEQQINYDVYKPQIQVLIASQRFRELRDAGQLRQPRSGRTSATPRGARSKHCRITKTGSLSCMMSRATSASKWTKCAPV